MFASYLSRRGGVREQMLLKQVLVCEGGLALGALVRQMRGCLCLVCQAIGAAGHRGAGGRRAGGRGVCRRHGGVDVSDVLLER